MPKNKIVIPLVAVPPCDHVNSDVFVNPEGSFHFATVFCRDCHEKLGYKRKPKPKTERVPKTICPHNVTFLKSHKDGTTSSKNHRVHCSDCGKFLKFSVNDDKLKQITKGKALVGTILANYSDQLTNTDQSVLEEMLRMKKITMRERKILLKYVQYLKIEEQYYAIYYDPRKRLKLKVVSIPEISDTS